MKICSYPINYWPTKKSDKVKYHIKLYKLQKININIKYTNDIHKHVIY